MTERTPNPKPVESLHDDPLAQWAIRVLRRIARESMEQEKKAS